MAQLKFFARDDQMVAVPGSYQFAGQVARYVGREWSEELHGFPAVAAPFTCDENSDDGRRMVKLVRRDLALWPGDEYTASACGTQFVPVELKDGVMVPKAKKASS